MKYKGFVIQPVPLLDYKPDPKSLSGEWKAVKVGVEYYEILDPIENDKRLWAEDTIQECKRGIDELLVKLSMKDNTKKSWDKLEACNG